MDKSYCTDCETHYPIEKILKRQLQRKKIDDKSTLELTSFEEIEKFIENFNDKQNEIEKKLESLKTIEHEKLHQYFAELNEQIQSLQKFYSNATIFLRVYDKKICQNALQSLQMKLKDLENELLPKKKFGFKNKPKNMRSTEKDNGVKAVNVSVKNEKYLLDEFCGFSNKRNEILILKNDEVENKNVMLENIKNCSINIHGNPSTMHITNLENCQVFSGPVTTSVFVEKVEGSSLHLACQQLRIHETRNTNFFIHVTSKAIIEDSKDVRFGIYKLVYEGIDDHYKKSGLDRLVNNWDKVDDFNWLAINQPSPNWSLLPV